MLVDRFVPPSSSRVVDYVAVMTVKLAPQLREDCDEISDVKQVRGGRWISRGVRTERLGRGSPEKLARVWRKRLLSLSVISAACVARQEAWRLLQFDARFLTPTERSRWMRGIASTSEINPRCMLLSSVVRSGDRAGSSCTEQWTSASMTQHILTLSYPDPSLRCGRPRSRSSVASRRRTTKTPQ